MGSLPRVANEWAHASWDNAEAKLLRQAAWPGGCGAGDHTLAASSGPISREESEKTPKSSCCLTKCKDNPRVIVVAIVLVHRADLPESVKTRPWYLRIDRLAQLSEEPHLLLIPEHQLAS